MTLEGAALTGVLTLLAVALWSAVVSGARAGLPPLRATGGSARERGLLILMLAPVAIGAATALAALVTPTPTFDPPNLDIAVEQAVAMVVSEPEGPPPIDVIGWVAIVAAGLYLGGAAVMLARLVAQAGRLQRIARDAVPAPGAMGPDVALTPADAPAFAALSGRVVLPHRLAAALTQEQLDLVVAHERAHVRRGDPRTFLALSALDAVFWIAPFLRAQTDRCRLAAELACDAAVLEDRPGDRRAYAETLLAVLKHGAPRPLACAPAVFSTRGVRAEDTRLRRILTPAGAAPRAARLALAALALLAAPLAAGQLALARTTAAPPPDFTVAPVAGVVLAGAADAAHPLRSQTVLQRGVLISAAAGAPVSAPAAGRVALVAPHPDGLGYFVMIAHGAGYSTCFGPFAQADVTVGERVAAGRTIARVGAAGLEAAPVVFVEVIRHGRRMDPREYLRLPAAPA